MKDLVIPLLLSIVTTLLNYIFINSISSTNQQLTVQDIKQLMDYIRTDLMNEIKMGNQGIMNEIKQQGDIARANK